LRYLGIAVSDIPTSLTQETLALAVRDLAAGDRDLCGIVERFGPPPLWDRPAGFATLAHIVLEQQVSLSSAQAAFDRLREVAEPLTPERFLELSDGHLLRIGFSRQKARYVREMARAVVSGAFSFDGLADLGDDHAYAALVALSGVGPWTASIYMIEVLLRPDIWPAGDIALATAVAAVKGLGRRPDTDQMRGLAERWRPWRSVAARLFWHDYLSRRGRSLPSPG
jgi:DNA-3-methyladenine glycosylase II